MRLNKVGIIILSLVVKVRDLLTTGWVRAGTWETVALLVLQDHLKWGQSDSSSGKWASSLLPEDVHLKHKCFHDVLPRYVYHELQEVPLRPDGSSGSMIALFFFFFLLLGLSDCAIYGKFIWICVCWDLGGGHQWFHGAVGYLGLSITSHMC